MLQKAHNSIDLRILEAGEVKLFSWNQMFKATKLWLYNFSAIFMTNYFPDLKPSICEETPEEIWRIPANVH